MKKRTGFELLQAIRHFRENEHKYTKKERKQIRKGFKKELADSREPSAVRSQNLRKPQLKAGEQKKKEDVLQEFLLYKEHEKDYTDKERETIEAAFKKDIEALN